MIHRSLQEEIIKALKNFPAVVILGARQTGKTTLAKQAAKLQKKKSMYLDLENPADLDKLSDAYSYLDDYKDRLVIVDEVQRKPELFAMLRSLIDKHRKPGRFLLLGSASPQLVKGVSESLAGRVYTSELHPINLSECGDKFSVKKHWFRGGFPDMLTARSDILFAQRMDSFIGSFIERDLQNMFGVNFTNAVMRKFWQMLAHSNGSIWNAHDYARSLGTSPPTINRYLDLLEGAFMVHNLPAFYFNARKRIIRAPKVYLRDTGIMHRLIRVHGFEDLHGHPVIGASWEAYVIEQIYQLKNKSLDMFYYRTQDGAETDILLTKAGKPLSCIEIKYSNTPTMPKGFYECIKDLKTKQNFIITPASDPYRKAEAVLQCGLEKFIRVYLPKIK